MMIDLGSKQSQGDNALLVKHLKLRGVTTLMLYVDDIIATEDHENKIDTQIMLDKRV